MGSTTSKSIDPETPVVMVGRRSCSRNVSDHQPKENDVKGGHSNMSSSKSKGILGRNKDVRLKRADKKAYIPSETHFGEWGESSLSGAVSRNRSGSSHNPSSRFLSHFSFFSSNQNSRSSASSIISNDDNLISSRSINKTNTRQGCEFFPSCFMPTSPQPQDSDFYTDSDNSDVSSIHELGPDGNNNNGTETSQRVFSPRNGSGYNRRVEAWEPIEQNVRFSRTLSVGRLRDRVLNRPTFSELASFPLQSEQEMVIGGVFGETGSRLSNENVMTPTTSSSYSSSIRVNSLYGNHDLGVENVGARETSYPNLLEHRANFLERRRRIRSQVHALQRMGSRFENLSGHDRSCILSGQYRMGHCTCRVNNQNPNSARGSISRIVLLAEALSEVLDEIHQQSVLSSSQHTLTSLGSVPAPTEVVESLPVKVYRKLPKHLNEEDAQCYICLVEYEDGDEVRVLRCHHEFHRLCIDKWLKEIHRRISLNSLDETGFARYVVVTFAKPLHCMLRAYGYVDLFVPFGPAKASLDLEMWWKVKILTFIVLIILRCFLSENSNENKI
ncbi:hypothetical protein E3N88_08408 [Mikania micrantha]|uniref:RING-type domain-containing protein n=1 Tax=Mikania micrantha TaxID=192012 RepID=A0A5N6PGQ1_9ASTR|nr:hypothetical protein E3N88_08408 [Mikania micrantha]